LRKLRGKRAAWQNVPLNEERKTLSIPETNTLEIETEIDLQSATSVGLGIKSGSKDAQVEVNFNGLELQVLDTKAPLSLAKGERKLKLRIFIDRSVLEVFANETVCVTKTIAPLVANASLEIRADGGSANAKRIQAGPMKTIW
jgi:beta-fructofuranosidase